MAFCFFVLDGMYDALNNLIKTIYADGSIVESKPSKWGMPGIVVQYVDAVGKTRKGDKDIYI